MNVPRVHDPDFWLSGPDAELAEFRRRCPVAFQPEAGFWAITGHEQIIEMSKDPGVYSSSAGVLIGDRNRTVTGSESILYVDPPRHVTMRRIVNKAFTGRRVAQQEPVIEGIVNNVFDAIDGTVPVDAVDTVSAPVPLMVIAYILGVPAEDLPAFRSWSDAIAIAATNPRDPRAMAAADFFTYFNAKLDARIAMADPPEDVLTAIISDAELTRAEQLGFCMSLLVAGNETTRHLISGGLVALAEHPDQRAMVAADPTLIPQAVEEMLRWVTPILAMARTNTCPVTLGGADVDENSYMVMLYAAANRDEKVFGDDADTFDITRSRNPHLAFGIGEHFCLGAQLARLEAKIVFAEILRRWPNYEILDGRQMGSSTLLRETLKLPILLQPNG